MKKIAGLMVMLMVVMGLTGCAATTMIKKGDLDTQTKMSATIFLEPVSQKKRVVFVNIRNTSDKDLNIAARIKNTLAGRGYTLTQDPDEANFMLQANILKVGKSDARASADALSGGFGGALLGSAIGGSGNSANNAAIVGGILGFIGDAMVADIYYTMITDIQVKERPLAGEVINQKQNTSIEQGTGAKLTQNVSGGQVNWKTYRTRIVSTANKVNLKFDEALKPLENGLVRSISGIF
ncbi:IncF plasmid conjugative transfer surface exclusion protein TraT [Bathymodiolus heckerae thiotrophic gill symbiont]|uniref:complement resistance protein TraT n=1 Tax=Bathymodiolus heckerae thiotrophic gill symbiont TaxID=1052212 RepID=UPI0010B79B4B|nr:complement resistance protein TraT [Bathymodiolus heckerae thiotrophic gill symbiont]SMN13954.1 IncF plasmid conjugative transfer surface exclusion protein TraT [Bathymodiolus heckerae thiotrophic gill symbiont]